jgi:50S ribosomal protein L16 3-hydroxylase
MPDQIHEISCDIRELDTTWFLEHYWQKQVLVIRQAFNNFSSPLTAEELAGLACEEDVNSRIVIEKDGEHPWQPVYGPMDESVFATLPPTHWTLLVNDVEKHIPELAWIVDRFRFIPEWRIDDLMISYAPEGGSVGPHMDLYDVFILQAQGHRRWQINTQPVAEDNQVEDTPLRIQKDFRPEQSWLLGPGDIIYIPPEVSHFGVATDDCMSYSIGFRANDHADLLNDFIGYITRDLPPTLVYRDSDLTTQTHPNEITDDAIRRVTEIFRTYLKPDHPLLKQWFGRYISDTKADIFREPEIHIEQLSELPDIIYRHPASRFAFTRDAGRSTLFVDGQDYQTSLNFAEILCCERKVAVEILLNTASAHEKALLMNFFNNGKLISSLQD